MASLPPIVAEEARFLMHTYARQPVHFVKGSGVRLWDVDGKEYIDLVGGIATNVLGHSPRQIQDALARQAAELIHTSNLYYTTPQVEAAKLLVESAFPARVFFCNSGTEANEAAIKIARKWGQVNRSGAYEIVCARGAFHGRTLAALAATGNERYLSPFAPPAAGFVHVEYDDAGAVEAAIGPNTVAVMMEPILGESGVVPMSTDTMRHLRSLCDRAGILLILDEVQSGMGRTGKMWAHQHAGISPDVMTVAKGLGGGVPIGAVLANAHADVLNPGDHGCTFGGNPLVTAVAAEVLRTITREHLVGNAARAGDRLRAALEAMQGSGVKLVRGRGLMLAVELEDEVAQQLAVEALRQGLVINPIGTRVIRIVPPLTITDGDIDTALQRLASALAAVKSAPAQVAT